MKRIRSVGLALILIGIGWYGIWSRWASTRKWQPLDMPVSLSPGHVRTPEFEINTRSSYRIAFVARRGFGHQPDPSESSEYQYCLPDLVVSWSLSNQGHVVAANAGQRCDTLGELEAGSGRYVLDVEVSRDGSRFNALNPRLRIFEVGGIEEAAQNQGIWAFWGLIVLTSLGTGATICSSIRNRHEKLDAFFKAWPLTLPESQWSAPRADTSAYVRAIVIRRAPMLADYYLGDPRTRAWRPLSGISSISLTVVLVLLVPLLFLLSSQMLRFYPVGLKVRLLRPDAIGERSPGIQPVIIRVALDGQSRSVGYRRFRPHLSVNWKSVTRDDFEAVLQKELTLRPPNWPVYLEGDSELDWQDVVDVIAMVQKLHANVILLTSREGRPR